MHSIICGTTQSGKTTLALALVRQARKRLIRSLVYDVHRAPYASDVICLSFKRFLDMAKKSENLLLVVDDCATVLDPHDPDHKWLTCESRHQGHSVILIAQRFKSIPKTLRDNCEEVWMFRQSLSDCKEIAGDFALDWEDLRNGGKPLENLHFIRIRPSGVTAGSVDPVSGNVYLKK